MLFSRLFFSGLAFHRGTERQKTARRKRTGIEDLTVYGEEEERVAVTIPTPSEWKKEGNSGVPWQVAVTEVEMTEEGVCRDGSGANAVPFVCSL
jgi:hypothetical protein